jgi:hypothetical protein
MHHGVWQQAKKQTTLTLILGNLKSLFQIKISPGWLKQNI